MLLPLILFGVLVAGLVFFIQKGPWDIRANPPSRSATDILDDRYAKGEIDREEYLRRKQDLKGA